MLLILAIALAALLVMSLCGLLCVCAKIRSIRASCKLRLGCGGEAPSHNARRVRDRLMLGTEPGNPLVVTGSLAVRLLNGS